jgi:hypothetical protein
VLGKRVVDPRHASPKHLIAPGSAAGTVVAQIAARRLSASDKKTLASIAIQAPAWMRPTLVSIANAASGDPVRKGRRRLSMFLRMDGHNHFLCFSLEATASQR